jgi:hypothetical protein
VLHPLWDRRDEEADGWVLTRPSPVKIRHLATNPHVSCSYLGTNHDVAFFDCVASWVDGTDERARVWEWIASQAPPVGYDPATIFPGGPTSHNMRLLHLRPYRAQVAFGADLARGERPRVWRPEAEDC